MHWGRSPAGVVSAAGSSSRASAWVAGLIACLLALACALAPIASGDHAAASRRAARTEPLHVAAVRLKLAQGRVNGTARIANRSARRVRSSLAALAWRRGRHGELVELTRVRVRALRRHATATLKLHAAVPADAAPGAYTLLVCVDVDSRLARFRAAGDCRSGGSAVVPAPAPVAPPVVAPPPAPVISAATPAPAPPPPAPDTTITAGPSGLVNTSSATFAFTAGQPGSTFSCRLDGGPWSACSSPATYSDLVDGPHSFDVLASGPGGADATPAHAAWTVDTVAPDTTLTQAPAGTVNETAVDLAFTSAPDARFECRLDDGDWAGCTSPWHLASLGDGAHTAAVRAVDPAGNADPSPATAAWTVDTSAPETTVTSAPPTLTNLTVADVAFESSRPGGSFECQVDGGAYAACTSPLHLSGLAEGEHTVAVRALDALGRADPSPATAGWRVDTTPPDTSIASGPDPLTNHPDAEVAFTSEPDVTFECRSDSGDWSRCMSPLRLTALSDGDHVVEVRATDAAGNRDATPATRRWTVDTRAPVTTITRSPDGWAPVGATTVEFGADEASTFACSLDGAPYTACTSPYTTPSLPAGPHAVAVRATDAAGNVESSEPSARWTASPAEVDLCGSIGSNRTLSPDSAYVYVITCNVTVSRAATLTVQAGTVIKAGAFSLHVDGRLDVRGTAQAPVVFTSVRDDAVRGDTNHDGIATDPLPRDWSGIVADSGSTVSLAGARVAYADDGLTVEAAGVSVTGSRFDHNAGSAIRLPSGSLPLNGLFDSGNTAAANGHVNGVEIDCVSLAADSTITTRDDWQAEAATGSCSQGLLVPTGRTLTVTSGSVLKLHGGRLPVDGNLTGGGTFTSWADDSVGGAINGDDFGTPPASPAAGDWAGIVADGATTTVDLSGARVAYADDGLTVEAAGVSVAGSRFDHNAGSAIRLPSGSLPLNGLFDSGNTAAANGHVNGVELDCVSLAADSTITTRSDWQAEAAAGSCSQGLLVPTGRTLTVTSGSVLKLHGGQLHVDGNLTGRGTFTSWADDSVGGAIDGDDFGAPPAAPAGGDWAGIIADGSTTTIDLSGARVAYADDGLTMEAAGVSVIGTSFDHNAGSAIRLDGGSLPLNGLFDSGNTAAANGHVNGVELDCVSLAADSTIATRSDWQAEAAAGNCSTALLVPTGRTLTLASGSVLKLHGGQLHVDGNLTGRGTFTSWADDSVGSAINGDDFGTPPAAPAAGDWAGIIADGSTSNVSLAGARVAYADDGLTMEAAGVSVTGSRFDHNAGSAIRLPGGSLPLNGLFDSGNTATANGHVNGVELDCVSLGADATIATRPDWQAEAAAGNCSTALLVPSDRTLTLTSGSVLKLHGGQLHVDGRLTAHGTFTSWADDSIGGAIIGDDFGTPPAAPAAGDWAGITADDSVSAVDITGAVHFASTAITMAGGADVRVSGTISHNLQGAVAPQCTSPSCPNPLDARNVNWGDLSGPQPYGSGDSVSGDVTVVPWVGYEQTQARNFALQGGGGTGSARGSHTSARHGAGDPVDPVSGNFEIDLTDVTVPEPGPAMSVARSYNGQSTADGSFGPKWSFTWDTRLVPDSGQGTTDVEWGDGRVDAYTADGHGGFTAAAGNFATLARQGAGYLVRLKDGTEYAFGSAGDLTTVSDVHGNALTVSHDAGGRVSAVADASGRTIAFGRDAAGHVTSATDPAGHEWTYGYSDAGDLTSVHDPSGGTVHYGYDGQDRMTSATDGDGNVTATNAYDANSRVIAQTDATGETTTFAYDVDARRTMVTDPRGGRRVYRWDAAGRLVEVDDQLGHAVKDVYDAAGNLTSETDEDGGVSVYTYDDRGNRTSATDPDGHATRTTYSAANLPLTVTDPTGAVTAYAYDDARDLVSSTDPLGHVTAYGYDDKGERISRTDPLGHETAYGYDAHGDQTSVTDPLGRVTTRDFDALGREKTETDPAGDVTRFAYDETGRRTSVTDPTGATTATAYDAAGNVAKITDADGRATGFTYDGMNRRLTTTDAAQDTVHTGYDADGNATSSTSAEGHTSSAGFDAANRETSATDALGKTTTYTLDGRGDVTAIRDPLGHTTTVAFDGEGNTSSVEDPLGKTTVYARDADGRVIGRTDANGHATAGAYDLDGDVTSVTDGLDRTTRYRYDADRELTDIDYPDGTATHYAYDAAGQLSEIDWPGGLTSTFSYDPAGRLTRRDDPAGTTTWTYDDAGRVTGREQANGQAVALTYDAAGLPTARTALGVTETFDYDAAGRLAKLHDPAGEATYGYDRDGNLTGAGLPGGVTMTRTVDAAQRTSEVKYARGATTLFDEQTTRDDAGRATHLAGTAGARTYAYDADGRLASAAAGATTTSYGYDGVGNRTRVTIGATTTTTSYDAADQVSGDTYDARGRLTAAGATTFSYDGRGQLTRISDPSGSATYSFDDDGVLQRRSTAAGSTAYAYDPAAAAPTLLGADGQDATRYLAHDGETDATVSPTATATILDELGSVRGSAGATGSPALTTFDPWGVPAAAVAPGTPGFAQGVGLDGGAELLGARSYLPSSARFLTPDPTGAREAGDTQSLYAYAADDPLDRVDPTGEFSISGALHSVRTGLDVAGGAIGIAADFSKDVVGAGAAEVYGIASDAADFVGNNAAALYYCAKGIGDDITVMRAGRATASPSSTYVQDLYREQVDSAECDDFTWEGFKSDLAVSADVASLVAGAQGRVLLRGAIDIGHYAYSLYETWRNH